ncbi:hypothetical protein [Streptomyces violascens]|uniref:hypothetical protein n=1 Tax=Streptomyces violascens TaxID=67381 RepID=UPI001E46FA48|nr:hypothetical protein [Streptomyces violascens]
MEDTIEKQITVVADRLGNQPRSARRYFDAAAMADPLARNVRAEAVVKAAGSISRSVIG